jgi:hypothetical protein
VRPARSFPERAERVLILGMVAGIVLIAQRSSFDLYQWGLGLLVGSTLLQIAVGNIPKDGRVLPSLLRIVLILAVVAAVFMVGIWLTPILYRLGR